MTFPKIFPTPFVRDFPEKFGNMNKGKSFSDSVVALFGSAVIGYWKLDEASGTAVKDSSPQMQTDGLYSGGVTLANAVSPPGTVSPTFDGTNGKASVQSAGWAADFNGPEGSVALFAKSTAPINFDYLLYFAVDSNNRVAIQNFNASGQYQVLYSSGGTAKNKTISGVTTDWFQFVITWSKADDKVRHYINGIESGVALTGLGVWAGSIATSDIGGLTGVSFWAGNLAHVYFLNRAMTPTEVATQYGYV